MIPAPTPMQVGPGMVIAETYRIERKLGEGGMGVVYEAQHLRVPKRVAVKVLRAHPDGDQLARFRQEAEVTSRLNHDGIVDIIDFNTLASGAAYIVMELLTGESLAARLRDRGTLPVEEVLPLVRQIASALHAAHSAGVVHRDLKPENVFLIKREQDGAYVDQVKLLDFGISKVHGSSVVQTAEDVVLGTPRYMAPEQALGFNEDVDPRCDQFALGVMAYEMLTGAVPFGSTNTTQVMFQIAYEMPEPLAEVAPHVPPGVVAAVERAMSKQPGARFNDLSQFVRELTGRALADTDRSSYPVLSAARIPEPPNRNNPTVQSKPRGNAAYDATEPSSPTNEGATLNERPAPPVPAPRPPASAPVAQRRSMLPFALIALALAMGTTAAVIALNKKASRTDVIAAAPTDASTQRVDAASAIAVPERGDGSQANEARDDSTPNTGSAETGNGSAAASGTGAGSAGKATTPVDAGVPKPVPTRVDAGVPKPVPTRPVLSPEGAEALAEAELAFKAGDFAEADRAARRALRLGASTRANEILFEVACVNRDLPAAHGWLRNLPRSTWPRMHTRCRARGFESTDP